MSVILLVGGWIEKMLKTVIPLNAKKLLNIANDFLWITYDDKLQIAMELNIDLTLYDLKTIERTEEKIFTTAMNNTSGGLDFQQMIDAIIMEDFDAYYQDQSTSV